MTKRLTLTGATLRARPEPLKRAMRGAIREVVWPWVEAGELRPVISHRLPIDRAADPQQLLEDSQQFGKVLLLT